MKGAVVDASVAVKWVVDEPDSDLAALLLDGRPLLAPDLLWVECGSVLWTKVRRGVLPAADAALAGRVLRGADIETVAGRLLLDDALSLALRLDHPVYDCLYLALAIQRERPFVTADRRFAERVEASGIAPGVVQALGG
jgi:predicted nucleic acid-binding protein